MHNALD